MKLLSIFWNSVPVAFYVNKWNDMNLKRLYQTVKKWCVTGSIALVLFYLIDINYMVPYRAPKKMYYPVVSTQLGAMFTKC